MKLRNLILAVIAGAALLTGCNKEVDLGPAKLEVNPTDVAFSQSVIATQDITLTATRDWAVTGLPDWIALSKESGPANTASQTITLSVTENKGNNRNATITFTIGFSRATLTVSQVGPEGEVDNGDGTKAKPFNVAGVIDYVTELGADVTSPKNVYVAGKISAISEAYTTQYGNGSFVISDDGETTGPQFTAYRVLYLGNKKFANGDTQIEVGDDVIVYGKVVNYKGNTPETSQNAAFLYSLNGVNKGGDEGGGGGESAEPQGKGTLDNPFNVAAAIAKAVETGETATETEYYIKGKVGTVTDQFNAQYGNATFTMVDEGYSATFTAYRVKYFDNKAWALGGKELAAGDEVIVCAKIVNFKGNIPE
ncbi:MAG: BACON domain-containing protein, partial [Bacteroidales bacterium]|nr:BACON domain-containing protein [Bacteroidales bacterium]